MRTYARLGNDKMEIRLGGIYALEKIAFENDYYYWSIMEIFTAYVRKNSYVEVAENKNVSLDIQAVLTVIERRKSSYYSGEFKRLNLRWTYLREADLRKATLEKACLSYAHLNGADLRKANLRGAKNLTIDQLSKAKTLYEAVLDEELEKPLRDKYPALFDEPKR